MASEQLARLPDHDFYQALHRLLADADFDHWIERCCAHRYEQQENRGQPSLPPGVFFRMLLVGYFKGLGSHPSIAWPTASACVSSLGSACRPERLTTRR